jgi:hypothetical protein
MGCKQEGENKTATAAPGEPAQSVAKEATWDYFLIGSWHYGEEADEEGELSKYPEGIEKFYSDGHYECYTQNKKGKKVLLSGKWKLDDKEDFVVWIYQSGMKTSKGKKKTRIKRKYVVCSIAPNSTLSYQVDGRMRYALWQDE